MGWVAMMCRSALFSLSLSLPFPHLPPSLSLPSPPQNSPSERMKPGLSPLGIISIEEAALFNSKGLQREGGRKDAHVTLQENSGQGYIDHIISGSSLPKKEPTKKVTNEKNLNICPPQIPVGCVRGSATRINRNCAHAGPRRRRKCQGKGNTYYYVYRSNCQKPFFSKLGHRD